MNSRTFANNRKRQSRRWRVRKKIHGTMERPRLSVFKSHKHLYAQLIDDDSHTVLAAASTLSKDLRGKDEGRKGKTGARKIGEKIAGLAKEKNIDSVIFDRGAHKYHGLLNELAQAAREVGLNF